MTKLLGIDSKTAENSAGWIVAGDFFKQKIDELEQRKHNCDVSTSKGRLIVVIISEILDTLERQLGEMKFFKAETTDRTLEAKMIHAFLTNLGCESEFAKLDNCLKVCGGAASLQTLPEKNVVTTNAYLVDSYFMDKNDDEKTRE